MALALVGGAVLSAALGALFDRAIPKTEFFTSCFRMSKIHKPRYGEHNELREMLLSHSLVAIKQALDDADDVEDMKVMKPGVQKWLNDLAVVLYDVEDFLDRVDEYNYNHVEGFLNEVEHYKTLEEVFRKRDEGAPSRLRCLFQCFPALSSTEPHAPNSPQSHSDASSELGMQSTTVIRGRQRYRDPRGESSDPRWLYFPPRPDHPMEEEMHSWTNRSRVLCSSLDQLQKRMWVLDLKKGLKGKPADSMLPTTAIPDEDHLSGRKEELGKILEIMRQNAGLNKKMSVIAIWGMPGVGKTSLAQHVYSDAMFDRCFDLKAWVYVSHDFNVVRFTKMILEAVSQQRFDTDDLNILQVTLSNKLSGMRFLLVLDDVWNAKFDSWDALLKPLKVESKETVVILTTQHMSASISSNADVTLQLKLLSPDDCHTIIKTHATHGNQVVDELLDEVCRDIRWKCKGLPLAAKAAGRLLRATPRKKWRCILENHLWNLVDDTTGILPALKLCYQYLPSYLKQCFSYCSLFPKDYEYDEKKLILLWIAEGLVKQPDNGKNIMEEGRSYFDELVSRSFFQKSSSNTSCFVMHELFHGLAEFVSEQFFCRVEYKKRGIMSCKIRHLSYVRSNCDNLSSFEIESFGHLRTFIAIESREDYFYISLRRMNDLVPNLKTVRVLSLSHYQIYHLSVAIGELKHLRLLDVSFTMIKHLPGTICNLDKLQILLLSHCSELMELPPDMYRLTSLWHIDLSGTALIDLPLNMHDLRSLHALGKIVGEPSKLHKLRDLKHLQGSLCVSISEGTPSLMHGSDSYLQHFESLQELEIDFMSASRDPDFQAEVLHLLEPNCGLMNLSIQGYGGRKFSDWESFFKFSHLVSLHIVNCEFCLFFPSLGALPSLKNLRLSGFTKIWKVGAELYGGGSQRIVAFKSLKTLMFENMPEWEEWLPQEGGGCDFCSLKELYLRDCPKLIRHMPSDIPSLEKLVISKCPLLNAAPGFFLFTLNSETSVLDNIRTVPQVSFLELSFLPQLRRLPQEIYLLTSLKLLDISNIPTIESFPDLAFPESLITLRIDDCEALSSFSNRLTHIVTLVISKCPSLMSLPENVVLASLKILKIKHCKNLQFMSFLDSPQKPNLTTLEIEDSCDSLRTFDLSSFPELFHLKICNCESLESLCFLGNSNLDLQLLHMYIAECTKLGEISLPEGGLPAPSLQELTLSRCPSLTSVPKDMFKRLTSLESLSLDYCPELQPVSDWDKLPSGLVSLSCPGAFFNSVWLNSQIHELLSLKHLKLDSLEVESFPQSNSIPSSITTLAISDFPNLRNIHQSIEALKCLEEFVIRNCPEIKTFPERRILPSLTYLQAVGCPLLEQDMLGEGRIKIAYIPCVIVGYTVI